MKLLMLFVVLNIINVILQTVKSIATVKCGKAVAALVNAIAFGLYTVVIVYTNCELSLFTKVIVTALTNLIGVYVVKALEEKMRKDKLWKVEASIKYKIDECQNELKAEKIPCNVVNTTSEYGIINCYCATQHESEITKKILDKYNAKYFVSESKIL